MDSGRLVADTQRMDSGFRLEHFKALQEYGGERWSKTPMQQAAYDTLAEGYRATEVWARDLKRKMFPDGRVQVRKAPLNRGTWFWSYNWARVWPQGAPQQLSYTVGIDANGSFILKVDTTTAEEPWRSKYLSLLGEDYGSTPFLALLSAEAGVAMTLEELTAWSIDAIGNFEFGYAEVARRLGLSWRGMRRLKQQEEIHDRIGRWRDALLEMTTERTRTLWLPDCRLVIRPGKAKDGRLEFQLGDDPAGRRWAVEVNEPLVSSDYNSPSAVAVDEDGRHYLLHQGLLRTGDGQLIGEPEFSQKSGLRPVALDDVGAAAGRTWYVVTPLHVPSARMRARTAAFVEACARVRGWTPALPEDGNAFDFTEESGESYLAQAQGPIDGKEVQRWQGLVWLRLKQVLESDGLIVCKTIRHRLGFQVDALIGVGTSMRLLVEIKTSTSAADIHGGVGQLHLYPKLIPSAAGLKRILLLPQRPHDDVLQAMRAAEVTPHFYDLGNGTPGEIVFDAEFLAECRACKDAGPQGR